MSERYGNVRVSKIIRAFNNLRAAIRSEGTPAIQKAWDRVEPWLTFAFERDEIDRLRKTLDLAETATATGEGLDPDEWIQLHQFLSAALNDEVSK